MCRSPVMPLMQAHCGPAFTCPIPLPSAIIPSPCFLANKAWPEPDVLSALPFSLLLTTPSILGVEGGTAACGSGDPDACAVGGAGRVLFAASRRGRCAGAVCCCAAVPGRMHRRARSDLIVYQGPQCGPGQFCLVPLQHMNRLTPLECILCKLKCRM